MIMCEAFRTPEHKPSMRKKVVENCIKNGALTKAPREVRFSWNILMKSSIQVQSRMRSYESNINDSASTRAAVISPTQPRTSSAQSNSNSPDLFVVPNLPSSSTSTPLVLRYKLWLLHKISERKMIVKTWLRALLLYPLLFSLFSLWDISTRSSKISILKSYSSS